MPYSYKLNVFLTQTGVVLFLKVAHPPPPPRDGQIPPWGGGEFRGGSRIQKGGFRTFRRGGFVQEFQERIQIVAGSWADQQAKKKCRQP